MRPKNNLATLLIVFSVAAIAGQADAQVNRSAAWGWAGAGARAANVVVPQRRVFNHSAASPVQITGVEVGVVILEQVATTTMDIHLRNPTGRIQEATMVVPVPDSATVRGFDFQGSAKEPQAKLLRRDEARRIYDEIVRKTRDPALLEFCRLQPDSVQCLSRTGQGDTARAHYLRADSAG